MRWLTLMLGAVLAVGCDDLDEYRVSGNQKFQGPVVGSDSGDAGPSSSACAFVLCGFAERTTLTLTEFDPDLAGGPEPTGRISTSDGTFEAARLVSVPGLQHDALSEYTFPGGGRVRNYIVGARFGANDRRYAMVFISLMDNGRIEARVHAPSTDPNGNDALFGVFHLCRGGCDP
jgi:hypothetical protein